jgi:hypothetical protein
MATDFPAWKHELPGFPHKMIDTPLRAAVDFVLEHIRRNTQDGNLTPFNFWLVCRGLLLGAMQSYASVCLLLSEKRPKPLMLQAGILNRSTFETLVNISALIEDPSRVQVLDREAFKSLALRYVDFRDRHGTEDKWKEYLAIYLKNLESIAALVGLGPADIAAPDKIVADWPTPGVLIFGRPSRKVAPWVSGNRREALKRLYDQHYPHQSELAHQRIAAVSAAMLVDHPEAQWNPGHGESGLVLTAAVLLACILAELQLGAGFAPHPKLAETWAYLRQMDEDVQYLWTLRYGALVSPGGA